MKKVSESIWSNRDIIIPMADVQHIEKTHDSKGELTGIIIVMKYTQWDMNADTWANNAFIDNIDGKAERFIKDFCFYRHELEGGPKAFKRPEDNKAEDERYDCPTVENR